MDASCLERMMMVLLVAKRRTCSALEQRDNFDAGCRRMPHVIVGDAAFSRLGGTWKRNGAEAPSLSL